MIQRYPLFVKVVHLFEVTVYAESDEEAMLNARRLGLAAVSVKTLPDCMEHYGTDVRARFPSAAADLSSII
jgi:hypothetical protein